VFKYGKHVRANYSSDKHAHLLCHKRPTAFTALAKLFQEPQFLADTRTSDDAVTGITEIDYEEQTAGYQAAYSRLASSEKSVLDPVAYVRDARAYVEQQLQKAIQADPRVKTLIAAGDHDVVNTFGQYV
jgi:exportin-2 (importin alpha re-exporter)